METETLEDDVDSYSLGEALGDPVLDPESDHGSAETEALSDSPSASKTPLDQRLMAYASENPLRILGPEFFEDAIQGLYRQKRTRDMNAMSGMIVATIDKKFEFFWRDPEARARYIFACLMGLTWPSAHSENEKSRLRLRFEEGWQSGELGFLSGVPMGELEVYRNALCADRPRASD